MDKIKLQEKIDGFKKENDQANQYLQNLEREKSRVIQESLIRNGRILELEEILKD